MFWKVLKPARVIVSLFFFIGVLFVFLDNWTKLPMTYGQSFLSLQFIPSVLRFFGSFALASAGFILISLLSLAFGRIYCSSICPLGTFQDIIIRITRIVRGKKYRINGFRKAQNKIRFGTLVLVIILFIAGNVSLLILLDPFSIFGRISTEIFRPAFDTLFDKFVYTLNSLGIYSLIPVEREFFISVPFFIAIAFLLAISLLSVFRSRWYCNVLCPAGTFMSLISKWSFFRISINKFSCTSCGFCSDACKANCINVEKHEIDFTRCIACQNCISECPDGLIRYIPNYWKSKVTNHQSAGQPNGRRLFFAELGVGMGVLISPKLSAIPATNKGKEQFPLRRAITPPGSLGREYFTQRCSACGLCISHCPGQVLKASFLEHGFSGMMQPFMDFESGFCNYDCTECGQVCPTGAIRPIKKEEKKITQIGIVRFIKELCIVVKNGTQCGACSEHCPTKACNMADYKDSLYIPAINPEICIGCGACEHVCPASPKSIVIDENQIHLTAKMPGSNNKIQNKDNQVDTNEILTEDFLF